jgi:hypothetical protein
MEFVHKVSKGSRYNQIYIPKDFEEFEAGDIVKVILLKKKNKIYTSKNLDLKEFKREIIERIFKLFPTRKVFVFGSFLFKEADYKDIDILLINGDEEKDCSLLIEKMGLKFHVLAMKEQSFEKLIKICPLTRSMLSYFASNKEFKMPQQEYDKKHLEFLLMMPQDILKIDVNNRIFYDNLRRLVTIERFLEKKSLDSMLIEKELKSLFKELFQKIKDNETITEKEKKITKNIIKAKINKIKNYNK